MQPDSPLHGLEGLKHMDTAIVPGIYDRSLADEALRVSTEAAYEMVRRLASEEGLLVRTLERGGAGQRPCAWRSGFAKVSWSRSLRRRREIPDAAVLGEG